MTLIYGHNRKALSAATQRLLGMHRCPSLPAQPRTFLPR